MTALPLSPLHQRMLNIMHGACTIFGVIEASWLKDRLPPGVHHYHQLDFLVAQGLVATETEDYQSMYYLTELGKHSLAAAVVDWVCPTLEDLHLLMPVEDTSRATYHNLVRQTLTGDPAGQRWRLVLLRGLREEFADTEISGLLRQVEIWERNQPYTVTADFAAAS